MVNETPVRLIVLWYRTWYGCQYSRKNGPVLLRKPMIPFLKSQEKSLAIGLR